MPCCNGCKYQKIVQALEETFPELKDNIDKGDITAIMKRLIIS